ncbi:helix-turn-helix transcriptional regulator [Kiloniella litopenaei]|uniref:helix-turn-helix transcriptional regulator n=1 Tax=Kiloniella litopenaei TaxID=1549748 RepID=UPI003BACC75D
MSENIETITLPLADYEILVAAKEELDDIIAYDKAMSDESDGLPSELMKRLIDGDNSLTVFREWRGLSQNALANASGVNRVQINDIEAGRKTGSVQTLKKLADTLDITIDDLV